MDLEDFSGELQQDEWSLLANCFGEEGQLQVVGWCGRDKFGAKLYVLKCSKCSQDPELFGQGYFRVKKSHLTRDIITPCGCSNSYQGSEDYYEILCQRKAKELGYTFLGFVGKWGGSTTKVDLLCEKHGNWQSTKASNFIKTGTGCLICNGGPIKKPDEFMIQSFFASGAFHPATKFCRIEGFKRYWHMLCPECGVAGESFAGNLQKGCRPCGCSKHRQQEAYINTVTDTTGDILAIKFGVANNSSIRVKQQDFSSSYTVKQHLIYYFPSITACKRAERDCKKELECGILTKEEMPDGWTETTLYCNLEKIVEIYERNGGSVCTN